MKIMWVNAYLLNQRVCNYIIAIAFAIIDVGHTCKS